MFYTLALGVGKFYELLVIIKTVKKVYNSELINYYCLLGSMCDPKYSMVPSCKHVHPTAENECDLIQSLTILKT